MDTARMVSRPLTKHLGELLGLMSKLQMNLMKGNAPDWRHILGQLRV